jgi:MGT family glycosyltransferase
MKILLIPLNNISHYKVVKEIIFQLTEEGHTVTCAVDNEFKDAYLFGNNINVDFIYYDSTNIDKKIRNLSKHYKKKLEELGFKVISKTTKETISEYMLYQSEYYIKSFMFYKEDLLVKAKDFSPDIIIRDTCAFWGKMIGEELGIEVIGYITNLLCNDEVIKLNPMRTLSDATKFDMSFLSDRECVDFYYELEKSISGLSYKLNSPKLPVFFPLESKEKYNLIFTNKLLHPKIKDTNDNKFIFIKPDIFIKNTRKNFDDKKNIIYVSTGSMISAPPKFYNEIIKVFKNTEYEVIISSKLVDIPNVKIKLPDNIKMYSYVNQEEILENACLFITHGGYKSICESIYYEVPMIVFPMSSDQFYNATVVEKLNIGLRMDNKDLAFNTIKEAAIEVLNNPNFCENIKTIKSEFYKEINFIDAFRYILNEKR